MLNFAGYIQKVRAKSENEKKPIVLAWTVILIVIIFLIWVLTFGLSIINNQNQEAELKLEAERGTTWSAKTDLVRSWPGAVLRSANEVGSAVANGFWVVVDKLHR